MNSVTTPETTSDRPLADAPCFIEAQFPVAKLSMESYKERKAGGSQTLTGLGKWWGRKPLVLVRAAILGLLLPATDNPQRDGDVFLKLMTMDVDGLWQRKSKPIAGARLIEELRTLAPSVQRRFLNTDGTLKRFTRAQHEERDELQRLVFERMAYSEKLEFCDRPEQIDGPCPEAWAEINAHLGTQAQSLPELVEELGMRRFGHRPRVGDAFCGGGSIPFEAARLGCDAYGSDLNPVAALLTWAALNIIGGGPEVVDEVQTAQREVYDAVDRQVTGWGIEHNSRGWRADAYLYCVEVVDPDTGWRVPLAPSWVIAEKTNVVARLVPDVDNKRYAIEVIEGASNAEVAAAREGTVRNSQVVHPNNPYPVPIERVRSGMRMWENEDVIPRPDDVFQQRLYCIRWVETYQENEREKTRRHYRAPGRDDWEREAKALALLGERFDEWQRKGYIPSRRIEPGAKTDEPIRTRGWTHWHHLFTPRQLLVHGLLGALSDNGGKNRSPAVATGIAMSVGQCCNWNSKLCIWNSNLGKSGGIGVTEQTFANQALNTLYNFGIRPVTGLKDTFVRNFRAFEIREQVAVVPGDARACDQKSTYWITDPPYADAVNYQELSEFYLAWYDNVLSSYFPSWSADSMRSVAVQGSDASFRSAMATCYSNLASLMHPDGLQVVLFTHQDSSVWAELTTILWAAGLRVASAWTITTETPSGLKVGNYVQGTVLLVLRKRVASEPVFQDEIVPEIEAEVRRQLDFMTQVDDASDPNFADADYQLAAYAAALRVLTARPIYEIDPARELARRRAPGEISPVEKIIRNAVRIACDHLVPEGVDGEMWKSLEPAERFYLKGLEVESHGEHRAGVYQELARGFSANDYTDLLATSRANETRLKTAGEFGSRQLEGSGFAGSLLRQVLFAVHQAAKTDDTRAGVNYLKTGLSGPQAGMRWEYWSDRQRVLHLLAYLARRQRLGNVAHWQKDAEAAQLLWGAVTNDHV